MMLLVVVLNDTNRVPDVLEALLELDVRKTTAIETESLVHICAREAPIFAGLRQLVTDPVADSRTIFGLVDGTKPGILDEFEEILNSVDLSLRKPGLGFAFLLPVSGVLASEEED
jgi:hypothetical protein